MAVWTYGLTDLDGNKCGEVINAYDRKFSKPLNALDTASFRVALSNPIVDEVLSRNGDVLLCVYRDSTLEFVGDLLTMEEVGAGYRRVLSREGLVTRGLSIGDSEQSYEDTTAMAARGLFEEVITGDVVDAGLRQALVQAHVAVRKQWREVITFDSKYGTGDDKETVAFNFAGPLWRLSKRIWGPSRASVDDAVGLANDRGQILLQLVGDTNDASATPTGIHDTGIRQGTIDPQQFISWGPVTYKPIAEAFTEIVAVAVLPYETPASWGGSDNFNTGTSALGGRTANTGGTWSTNGLINQPHTFNVTTGILHRRSAPNSVPADPTGEYGFLPSLSTWTDTIVEMDCATESAPNPAEEAVIMGVLARYIPGASPPTTAKWIMGYIASLNNAAGSHRVGVKIRYASGVTQNLFVRDDYGLSADVTNQLRLQVTADGHFYIWAGAPDPTFPTFQGAGYHVDLATGGQLAAGSPGIHDHKTTDGECWRTYDNWQAAIPVQTFVPHGIDFELAPVFPTPDANGVQIANLNVKDRLGTTKPHAMFDYGQGVPTNPTYGVDYIVGDSVPARGKSSTGSTRFGIVGGSQAYWRIYGIDISIDEEGRVTETPTLVPDS